MKTDTCVLKGRSPAKVFRLSQAAPHTPNTTGTDSGRWAGRSKAEPQMVTRTQGPSGKEHPKEEEMTPQRGLKEERGIKMAKEIN